MKSIINHNKNKSIWISATGTDVGKTILSTLIMNSYSLELNLRYWKPLQTGITINPSDTDFITERLKHISRDRFLPEYQSWKTPSAPNYAAEKENSSLILEDLIKKGNTLIERDKLIIEGAGGPLVPLNDFVLQVEIMNQWNLPVILVSRTGLGTIHDTLSTIESCKTRGVKVLGFYMIGEKSELTESNIKSIIQFSKVGHLGTFFLDPGKEINLSEISSNFWDPEGKVKEAIS
jgi:dethiobiotin synthetase